MTKKWLFFMCFCNRPSGFWCLITWKITAVTELLSSADIVIEYEASKDSDLYKKCLTANIPYVGISMDPVTTQCGQYLSTIIIMGSR